MLLCVFESHVLLSESYTSGSVLGGTLQVGVAMGLWRLEAARTSQESPYLKHNRDDAPRLATGLACLRAAGGTQVEVRVQCSQ
jgi:hypothetical protein